MFMETVFQHLVGAKLEIVMGKTVLHHSHSTADAPTGRSGVETCERTPGLTIKLQ